MAQLNFKTFIDQSASHPTLIHSSSLALISHVFPIHSTLIYTRIHIASIMVLIVWTYPVVYIIYVFVYSYMHAKSENTPTYFIGYTCSGWSTDWEIDWLADLTWLVGWAKLELPPHKDVLLQPTYTLHLPYLRPILKRPNSKGAHVTGVIANY